MTHNKEKPVRKLFVFLAVLVTALLGLTLPASAHHVESVTVAQDCHSFSAQVTVAQMGQDRKVVVTSSIPGTTGLDATGYSGTVQVWTASGPSDGSLTGTVTAWIYQWSRWHWVIESGPVSATLEQVPPCPTTTTTGVTTTTVPQTTTTVPEVTTTTDPATTTSDPTVSIPETTVPTTFHQPTPPGELPRTGSSPWLLAAVGAVLVALGLAIKWHTRPYFHR